MFFISLILFDDTGNSIKVKIVPKLFYVSSQLIAIQSGHRAGTDCGIAHACYMNKLSSRRVAALRKDAHSPMHGKHEIVRAH